MSKDFPQRFVVPRADGTVLRLVDDRSSPTIPDNAIPIPDNDYFLILSAPWRWRLNKETKAFEPQEEKE